MIVLWGSARAVELPLEQLRFDPDPLALNSLPLATVKATVGLAKGGWEGGPATGDGQAAGCTTANQSAGDGAAGDGAAAGGRAAPVPYWLPELTIELMIFCGVAFWAAVLAALAAAFWR